MSRRACWLLLLLAACGKKPEAPAPAPSASAGAASVPDAAPAVAAEPDAQAPPAQKQPCPEGMALIDGRFCIDRWEASTRGPDGREHSPHHAVGPLKVRAESRSGVLPQAYISAEEGDAACRRAGKYLCTTQEWQDACMGVKRPYRVYPYGMEYEKGACNVARRLHPVVRIHGKYQHDSVILNDPKLNQLDETVAKTGEFADCVTPEGVFDLQGNLLEWTQGDKKALLMGGHYVEAKLHGKGCRYVTAGHGAEYHDFTTGFRCCTKADKSAIVQPAEPPPVLAPLPSDGGAPADPPGMRGFASNTGKLPKLVPPPYEPKDAKCPVDMVHVEGQRCSEPKQFCRRWLPRLSVGQKIACAEFAEPSECQGSRRKMSYCIDQYEFTPPGYTHPLTHVSYGEAQNLCLAMDKRLCFEDEWEFACEGPEALPYPYGYVRDGKRCNHDFPEEQLVTGPDQFIDRRVPRDALPECKSPFGVFNLVGNVDEWTSRYNQPAGKRAILRGGWWLIGRNRCRAATANHGERYAGVQTGFRCCKASRGAN
ncbi:MAG: SUMF1/EgtB/PvdO family nonheme iron enzyme [Polyangiaceae bacterium]|nr:SUMF1/EgtB/PvdO family nonheme iron enzyme [Polyangiaceae bacterium]MCL4750869.1 SUMF1/EgtB/PvdO family nonheme iron enzyme [Myxococcales bacterium]